MDTVLGPVVTADEVCAAVEATIRAWIEPMLDAMGADGVEPPRDYEQVPSVEAAAQNANLPAVGILSSGWADPPERDEDGNLQITWRVSIVAFIRGDDYATTQHNTRTLGAAISTILAQQHTLLGFASGTDVVGESYEAFTREARTLGAALIDVDVTVDNARNDLAATDGLPPSPLPVPAVADAVTVTVVHPVTT